MVALGFGGVAAPLVCQAIIDAGIPWSHFYLGSLVLSALSVVFLVITFRPTRTEFLHDQENALIVAISNRLAKDLDTSYMEAMSPTSKSELNGTTNYEYKRNTSKHHTIILRLSFN